MKVIVRTGKVLDFDALPWRYYSSAFVLVDFCICLAHGWGAGLVDTAHVIHLYTTQLYCQVSVQLHLECFVVPSTLIHASHKHH